MHILGMINVHGMTSLHGLLLGVSFSDGGCYGTGGKNALEKGFLQPLRGAAALVRLQALERTRFLVSTRVPPEATKESTLMVVSGP